MPEPAPGKSLKKRLFLLIPFVLFLGFVLLAFFRIAAPAPDSLPAALAGRLAPRLIMPQLIPPAQISNGGQQDAAGAQQFDTATFKGRVTLVNFWGSWCPPCRAEHGFLLTLADNPAFRLAGVNYKDSRENAARFLGQFGNPFAEIGFDGSGNKAIDWGVYGPPETFILSKSGIILYRYAGPLDEQTFREKLLPVITKANEEK